jgi:flagellar motility protein MotE (MotC chaperone)
MAAAQLSTSDEDTATGVLLKLKPRVASEILDEMEPAQAARLTQLMVGFSDSLEERSF